jgi:uncharacterized protein YcbK (DUF882 family)
MTDNHRRTVVGEKAVSRRHFLKLGATAAAALIAQPALGRTRAIHEKKLSLYNAHTGESLKTVYWEQGRYVPDALSDINHLLRDFRTGDVYPIEPFLLDVLCSLRHRLGTRKTFYVVSGYRSPATNEWLRLHSPGVAKHSLHMAGEAADINLPGYDLDRLHRAALSLRAGGVGYYPKSDFIHVDVGRVRTWSG